MRSLSSLTDNLQFVKVPLSKEDFTEDGIPYTIPAKEFFNLINMLQDQIELLSKRVDRLEVKVFNLDQFHY